jgi:Ca2+-binding RTX toxin-like protein
MSTRVKGKKSGILIGDDESDTLKGRNGKDILIGDDGDDTLDGGNGKDILIGSDGDDILNGGNGKDILYGGAGSDIISGGNGDDIIVEFANENAGGYDFIDGGRGSDTLVLHLTAHQQALLSQALYDFNAAKKSSVFSFGAYAGGILNIDVVNVEKIVVLTVENSGPADISLNAVALHENDDTGPIVGALHVSDPDVGDTHTFTVNDDRFEAVNGHLKLKAGVVLDYEIEPQITVTVTVTDQAGASFSKDFTLEVLNVNEAPTAIALSNMMVEENAAGAVVGVLHVTDPDVGDVHTFTVSDDRFEVVDGMLKLKDGVSLDHEAEPDVMLHITATDAGGLFMTIPFTIHVANVNEAPMAIVLSNMTVEENAAGAVMGVLHVADPDAGDTHTFTVSDDRFEVVDGLLKLKDGIFLDHEAEPDVVLEITATDAGGLSTTMPFTILVNDIPEGPPIISATAEGQTVSGINDIIEILRAGGYHAILIPGVGDIVHIELHHDQQFSFNNNPDLSLGPTIDTLEIYSLNDPDDLSSGFKGALNLFVDETSFVGTILPKTLNFDFDEATGAGLDVGGLRTSIYTTNFTLIEIALITHFHFNLVSAPLINIILDEGIDSIIADVPDKKVNFYQGLARDMNIINEGSVPLYLEDNWGDTTLVSGGNISHDVVQVKVLSNIVPELSNPEIVQLPFINNYDAGAGEDTLIFDLTGVDAGIQSEFVAFKNFFDALTLAEKQAKHMLLRDGSFSTESDLLYSFTFKNFELFELVGLDPVNEVLIGTDGADVLIGGEGNDILFGKAGNDILTGGSGQDTFVFDVSTFSSSGRYLDQITDFNPAEDFLSFTNVMDVNGSLSITIDDIHVLSRVVDSGSGNALLQFQSGSGLITAEMELSNISFVSGNNEITHYVDASRILINDEAHTAL